MDPKENPFFLHAKVKLFLAYRDKEPVGRIAAVIDRQYIDYYKEDVGYFGLFETLKDYSIAVSLFKQVENFLKENGMKKILGPMNLSTNHECGLLIDGFDLPPAAMMPYNLPYYQEYIERYGFKKAKDLYAYFVDFGKVDEGIFEKIRKRLSHKGFKIRPIRLDDPEEAKNIKEIYNSIWSENWGFVPLTEEEFSYIAKELRRIVIPDLALAVEKDGEIVGFNLCIPDVNQVLKRINGKLFPFGIFKWLYFSRKINLTRGLTVGIKREYRRALGPLLYSKIAEISKKKGYLKWEIGWVLEDNNIVNNSIMRKLNPRLYKKYRIFVKDL